MDPTAVLKCFDVQLDLKRSTSNREFEVVEGDTANRIVVTLTDNGEPVPLEDNRVLAIFSNSRGTACQDSNNLDGGISLSDNKVIIDLFPSAFAVGMVECELQVYSGESRYEPIGIGIGQYLVTSAKFNFTCRRSILNGDTIAAVNEFPLLMELLDSVTAQEHTHSINEAARIANENQRCINETQREAKELLRQTSEGGRISGETVRIQNENQRIANESVRISSELERRNIMHGRITQADFDNTVAYGWYEYGGGFFIVESPISVFDVTRPDDRYNVHQVMLPAYDGIIQCRDGVNINNNIVWGEWRIVNSTPIRGVDYWTDDDIEAIHAYVDNAIIGGLW